MLKQEDLTITNIRRELDKISHEMMSLIKKYQLSATSPLDVVEMAKARIDDKNDYIRFLELSLEGRIYGDAASVLENATVKTKT